MLESQHSTTEPEAAPEGPDVRTQGRGRMLLVSGAVAGVVLFGLAVLLLMLGPMPRAWLVEPVSAAAAASPDAPGSNADVDGREAVARQRAILEAERERLYRLSDQAVSAALAIEFGAMRLRATNYAAWAYGWVPSYVTSYQIIGRGIAGGFNHLISGQPGSTLDAMATEATSVVREYFRALVVQPERTQKALDAEWDRIAGLLNHEFLAIERRQEDALAALKSRVPPAETQIPKASRVPAQSRGNLVAETPDIDTILVRSARPWAARAGILVLRLTEVGSVAAFIGSLGVSFGPLTGLVVGVVGGIGFSWVVDYVINSIDAALHREELESHALAFVDALENESRQRLNAAFRLEIDSHISAIEGAMTRAFP